MEKGQTPFLAVTMPDKNGISLPVAPAGIEKLGDAELISLRLAVHTEMKRRGLATSVGQLAEKLAIDFCNCTPGRPNLVAAPTGT